MFFMELSQAGIMRAHLYMQSLPTRISYSKQDRRFTQSHSISVVHIATKNVALAHKVQ